LAAFELLQHHLNQLQQIQCNGAQQLVVQAKL
jgi:hypothetical protein